MAHQNHLPLPPTEAEAGFIYALNGGPDCHKIIAKESQATILIRSTTKGSHPLCSLHVLVPRKGQTTLSCSIEMVIVAAV